MLKKFALITTVLATAAYCWLTSSIFEPRVCIDSTHIAGVTANLPITPHSTDVSEITIIGRGLCGSRANLPGDFAHQLTDFSSEFSDLERFATWTGRPLNVWDIHVHIVAGAVGIATRADGDLRDWKIPLKIWADQTLRRRALVGFWLARLRSTSAQVTDDLSVASSFLARRIWPHDGDPSLALFDSESLLSQEEVVVQIFEKIDRQLWMTTRAQFYRAIADAPVAFSIRANTVHRFMREFDTPFFALTQNIQDLSVRNEILNDGRAALISWIDHIESLPVVIRFSPLIPLHENDRVREKVEGHLRRVNVEAQDFEILNTELMTFHNRIVLEQRAPTAIKNLASLQKYARHVLVVPAEDSTPVHDPRVYDTYFRLGAEAFALDNKDVNFFEIALPALALAVQNGVSPEFRLSAQEDFSHPRSKIVAQLVDGRTPVTAIEYFRKNEDTP